MFAGNTSFIIYINQGSTVVEQGDILPVSYFSNEQEVVLRAGCLYSLQSVGFFIFYLMFHLQDIQLILKQYRSFSSIFSIKIL